jgi:integrase
MAKASRRQGQVVKRGPGVYRVRWALGTDERGRRVVRSTTVKGTLAEAERVLRERLGEAERGVALESRSVALRAYLGDWYALAERTRRRRTVDDYRKLLGRTLSERLALRRLDRVTPLDVERWVSELVSERKLAPQSVRQAVAVLSAAFQDAVRLRLLGSNPARGVALPRRERREMRALTGEECGRLREAAAGTPHEALWLVLLGCGLRPSEVLALRWADVDLAGARLRVERSLQPKRKGEAPTFELPKTERGRRTVPLAAPVVAALRAHRERLAARRVQSLGGLVFVGAKGQPLDEKNAKRRHYRKLLKAAKLDPRLRLYDLRHTFATHALAAGTPVHVVSAWLGHASAKMTLDVYAHALPRDHDEHRGRVEAAIFGAP